MSDLAPYFGENGPFAEACDLFRDDAAPAAVRSHAATLGESHIAYELGWCFHYVLHKRHIGIDSETLLTIARNKITAGNPFQFIYGFDSFTITEETDDEKDASI